MLSDLMISNFNSISICQLIGECFRPLHQDSISPKLESTELMFDRSEERRVKSLLLLSDRIGLCHIDADSDSDSDLDLDRCKDGRRDKDIDREEDINVPISHFQALQTCKNPNASAQFFLNLLDHLNGDKKKNELSQGKYK